MGHPNLSNEINAAILKSDIDGGVRWTEVEVGRTARIRTKNTIYVLEKREDGTYISGNPKYCLEPTKATISGSTWGGSMIKVGWVGVGMHLEFWTKEHPYVITTSEIQDVILEPKQ